MKKLFIILGNGFTIDFLEHYNKFHIKQKNQEVNIDVKDLFKCGENIKNPWDDRIGFLSYKFCPALWTLGARSNKNVLESNALIEEIITCANMFFEFVNEPTRKTKRLELANSNKGIYMRAYSELITYLRHLFSCYNDMISDVDLEAFFKQDQDWGWGQFFRNVTKKKFEKIIFVTYNYDIWLERILKLLNISFCIKGFQNSEELVEIIKPHGSISFVPKNYKMSSYGINYNLDIEGVDIDNLEIKYDNLSKYDKGAIIPPSGDSARLKGTAPWSKILRNEAESAAKLINENDEVILCGISYWHVDRKEIDELLISLNQNSIFTFINPSPPRDLNAVLISIFKNYILQTTSKNIGGIIND